MAGSGMTHQANFQELKCCLATSQDCVTIQMSVYFQFYANIFFLSRPLKAGLNEAESYIMRVDESWQSRDLVWQYLSAFPTK